MNTQEFENISLDLLMGRLTPEEQERFLSGLTSQERAEFSEKERMFNLVKKTGEVAAKPPIDLVDRIMSEVRKEGFNSNKKGFMDSSLIRKIAVPTALTMTVALALVSSNRMLTDRSLRPGVILEAEKPMSRGIEVESASNPASGGNEAYEDLIKYISDDEKNSQAAVREQTSQLDRISKEQKQSQEKLTGVISEIVNRIELLDEGLKKVENASPQAPATVASKSKPDSNFKYDGKDLDLRAGAAGKGASAPRREAQAVNQYTGYKRTPSIYDEAKVRANSNAGAGQIPAEEPAALESFGASADMPVQAPADSLGGRDKASQSRATLEVTASYRQATTQPPISIEGERYGQAEERSPMLVSSEPVSTFSIDVDTGGYTNLRKLILGGALPPSSSVRIEEMINYFDYNYPTLDGPEPFAFSYEAAPSPYDANKVFLKLGIKAKATTPKSEEGWNLVFLVDVSGSMSDSDKLPLLKDSMKVFAEHMRPTDKVSIVTYAGNAGVLLEPTTGNQKDKIFNAINTLGAGGSTNGSGGIMAAYQQAEKNMIKGGVNRVILATDGDFNVGVSSFDGLVKLIEEKRRSGVTLTTLGVGRGNYNEQNLEQLADKGNGNYFYLDSIDEASRVLGSKLTSNMEMVAKDVKLQIEFNPSQVASYRLIGYDNRKLNNEDFKNDAIDAGEIGAGHTVTAVYELVMADSKIAKNLQADPLRYQQSEAASEKAVPPSTGNNELAFLKIRYKAPQEDTSKLLEFPLKKERVQDDFSKTTTDFRFASAVAGFGQVLRESKYSGNISLDTVRKIASESIGSDSDGKRKEFVELIDQTKLFSR
jgi:Ca-activated chloride channel family protein